MIERAVAFISLHRRRIARPVLAGGLVLIALKLWPNWPRETEVEFALGAHHAEVIELHVAYLMGGQAVHGVTFNFPNGAPQTVRHKLTLPRGIFSVRCGLRARTGDFREVTRQLQAPSQGLVRIPLETTIGTPSSAQTQLTPGRGREHLA